MTDGKIHGDQQCERVEESMREQAGVDYEVTHRLMKEQVRVSDEAFNFHLKRANELDAQVDSLKSQLVESQVATDFANAACDLKDRRIRELEARLESAGNLLQYIGKSLGEFPCECAGNFTCLRCAMRQDADRYLLRTPTTTQKG